MRAVIDFPNIHIGQWDSRASRWILSKIINVGIVAFSNDTNERISEAQFVITLPNVSVAFLMLVSPTYWVAEAYTRGYWKLEKGDLADFLAHSSNNIPSRYQWYIEFLKRRRTIRHLLKQNIFHRFFTRKTKKHYEIEPDLYSKILDDELVYTSGFFSETESLSASQQRKFSLIADRLRINQSSDHILNIGCGWGGFERHVVRSNQHTNITGLSISSKQISWAKQKNQSSLDTSESARIRLLEQDYLNHQKTNFYSAISVVGMIEHVGQSGYPEFFEKCHDLLIENGRLLVHTIVKPNSNVPTNRWIDKYIFPGGYIPSVSEVTKGADEQNLRICDIHIHHPENYKKTLQAWRSNLIQNKDSIMQIYNDVYGVSGDRAETRFKRWEIYLAGSEVVFRLKNQPYQVAHFVFEKL